jgi:hypothetical protein
MLGLFFWVIPLGRSDQTSTPPLFPNATFPVPSRTSAPKLGFTQSQLRVVYSAISATALLIIIEAALTVYCRHRNREPSAPEDDEIGPTLSALELED